jgi:hypothetical protein
VFTAAALYYKDIPPMRWVIKDFLGEGITLLSGRPKGGKTLLAEQMGIAVATGGLFLGRYQTVKGAVLYVNVDDPNERRLQENLHRLGGRVDGLSFMSALPELDNGGLEILDQELARMAKIDPCRLLILDTLTALRREQSGKNLVKADHDFITLIKGLVTKHGCSVLLISHTRKDSTSSERVDSIDSHLGTTGITAAVDATMVLTGADDTKKVLKAKGRDISPFEVYLELQVKDRSGWVAVDAPAAPEKKLSALRQRILDAVIAIGPCGPDAVSKFTGDNLNTIRTYLPRMFKAKQLDRDVNGRYSVLITPPSILGVLPVSPVSEDPTTDTPNTPDTTPTKPVSPTQADPPAQNEDPADNDLTTWENIEEYSPDQESDPADWWQDPRDNDTDTQSDPPEYTPEPDSESKSSDWDSYLDSYQESNPQSQHESLDPPEATQRTPPPLLRAAHLPFGSGNSVEGGGEPSRYAPLAEKIQWHMRRGVHHVSDLLNACIVKPREEDFDKVWRAVKELDAQGIIVKLDGGWYMVEEAA